MSKLKQFIHDHGIEALKLELQKKTFMTNSPERLTPFNSLNDIQQTDWDYILNDELKEKSMGIVLPKFGGLDEGIQHFRPQIRLYVYIYICIYT